MLSAIQVFLNNQNLTSISHQVKVRTEKKSQTNMKLCKTRVLSITILFTAIIFLQICNGVSVLGSEIDVMPQIQRVCSKSIEDCFTDSELTESESNRRVLVMQKKYISYDTLKRDMVPCDKPGASYYECHSGQANSYNRGCQIITRCARGIKN